jgi:hypothetical protein
MDFPMDFGFGFFLKICFINVLFQFLLILSLTNAVLSKTTFGTISLYHRMASCATKKPS